MTNLLHGHRLKLSKARGHELTVENNLPSPCPGGRYCMWNRNRINFSRHINGADSNITESSIALGFAGTAKVLATIAHDSDIQIRVSSPGLKNLLDPSTQLRWRSQRRKCLIEVTALSGDFCSVRCDAGSEIFCVVPAHSGQQLPAFQ
jgi:hypothetical protein